MTRENYLDIPRFCARMRQAGVAAVVAASPNAVFHTSGCLIITHNPIRDRLAFCVTTSEGRQCLVVCKIEESLCEHDSWVRDIRGYVEFKELPTHLLAKTLADLRLDGKTIGIELEYLRESYFRELTAAAPRVSFVSADQLLSEMRRVKPARQVDRMRAAAAGASAALDEVFAGSLIGTTERQVRIRLRKAVADRGADGSYLIVAAGPNAAVPEHRAGERVLASGDVLVLDAAVTYDGYVAEAAASRVLGDGSEATRRLDAVYRAAASSLKPGARSRDIYATAKSAASSSGGKLAGDCVGYGLSFGGQEPPYLAPESTEALESGSVIALDVPYEDPSGHRLRTKRMWLITEDGATDMARSN